jgi:hypothetical protein
VRLQLARLPALGAEADAPPHSRRRCRFIENNVRTASCDVAEWAADGQVRWTRDHSRLGNARAYFQLARFQVRPAATARSRSRSSRAWAGSEKNCAGLLMYFYPILSA